MPAISLSIHFRRRASASCRTAQPTAMPFCCGAVILHSLCFCENAETCSVCCWLADCPAAAQSVVVREQVTQIEERAEEKLQKLQQTSQSRRQNRMLYADWLHSQYVCVCVACRQQKRWSARGRWLRAGGQHHRWGPRPRSIDEIIHLLMRYCNAILCKYVFAIRTQAHSHQSIAV